MPDYLAELLLSHHDKLKAWAPEDSATRAVQQLVFRRRAVVDERTGLTNRLQRPVKTILPARPWSCAGRSVAAPGDELLAEVAQPGRGERRPSHPRQKTFYYLHR